MIIPNSPKIKPVLHVSDIVEAPEVAYAVTSYSVGVEFVKKGSMLLPFPLLPANHPASMLKMALPPIVLTWGAVVVETFRLLRMASDS